MPVIVLINKNGKTEIITTIDFKGSPEDVWDPYRVEFRFENLGDYDIKVFSTSRGLNEIEIEDNTLMIYPESTEPPKPPKITMTKERRRVIPDHIAMITSIGEKCGIATYSRFLSNEIKKYFPITLYRSLRDVKGNALINLQHEFGIFPNIEELISKELEDNYKVCTWHTVMRDPVGIMLQHYHTIDINYDAHIVHNYLAKKYLSAYTRRPVYVIPHGSYIFEPTPKKRARKLLNLPLDKKIVYCFGFAAETKGFIEVAKASHKLKDTLFVISGAVHDLLKDHSRQVINKIKSVSSDNVIVLGKYLSEGEINLYASACDCLLFNYKTPRFVSSASGAMHRVLASGKPIVCTFDNRLIELEDGYHALKYVKGDIDGMIHCISLVLEDEDLASRLGINARRLAEKTSWREVAKMYIRVYNDIVGDALIIGGFTEDYYDKGYFADTRGKRFRCEDGSIERWGYMNPSGDWAGCTDIVKAWKKLFNPKNALDVGCGRGTFVAYMREQGIEAYGFDFSKWALTDGLFYRCKPEWVKIHDATNPWPYRDNEFDLVLALDFYEHIYEDDLDFVINEMFRVARKWIFLVIAVTKEGERGYILKKGESVPLYKERRTWAGHVTVCSEGWWRKRLERSGWRFRDDLVEKFINSIPKITIRNWILNSIIIMEAE